MKPQVHEKQRSLLCGKHAINNLLQNKHASTCEWLSRVGKTLSKSMNIPYDELVNTNTGYYDISVLVAFLHYKGYETEQIPRRDFNKLSRRQSPRLLGYIFGDGTHWMAVRKTNAVGCYYEIDSLDNRPVKMGSLKTWLDKNPEKVLAIKVLAPNIKKANVSVKITN